MDHHLQEKKVPRSKGGGDNLAWILIGILAVIALASIVLEGQSQSLAITAALVLGLVAIVVTSTSRSRSRKR